MPRPIKMTCACENNITTTIWRNTMQVKPLALIIAALVSAPAMAEGWTDIFKLSGSAEANYVVTDDGTTTNSELDRALLLNIDAAKKIGGNMTLGGRISQKIATGDTVDNKVGLGSREAYVSLAGDFGTVKAGRAFINSYLTLDWPFGQVGFWGVAEAGAGKVTSKVYLPNTLSYQSPAFGPLSFSAQHGWNNSKHSKDSVYDLAGTLSLGKATIYAGALGGKPSTKTKESKADLATGVVTETTTVTNELKNSQQYLGASVAVTDTLTLRVMQQAYKQTKLGTTSNKGKETSLGLTFTMGNAGYIKAAAMRQDNTGIADDFSRYAVQYGRDIGGGAEWYARLMKQSPKDNSKKDVNQFLTGVWIGF